MFILESVIVHDGCTGQKNLIPGKYTLVSDEFHKLPINFFDQNICISSIVGKNGSGKSSLLDIIYRVLNNTCAILCTNLNTVDYTAFSYIKGVRAELNFIIGNKEEKKHVQIKCIDNYIGIIISKNGTGEILCERNFGYRNGGFPHFTHITSLTDQKRVEIAKELFSCIVVNYAPFALNSSEYNNEYCFGVNESLVPDKIDIRNHNWLQSIFHKNDGYQSNITFVPYRDSGVFDATKESKLVRERILDILCTYPNFIDGYQLNRVHYRLNEDSFKSKFNLTRPTYLNGYKPQMEIKQFIQEFEIILDDYVHFGYETIATKILKELGYNKKSIVLDSRPHTLGYLYLVYKVLNCAQYPSLREYSELNDTDLAIDKNHKELFTKAILLTKAINTEHSHITFKINRTKSFLDIIPQLNWDNICSYGFDLKEYLNKFGIKTEESNNLIPIVRQLPPSFFDFEIFLHLEGKKDQEISFEKLSSGERQFYSSISSIIYHSMNIISVPEHKDRVKYYNVLGILDEAELCFHPEFQRVYINRLLSTIKRLDFNKKLGFHIILTTHSPFILSDIPESNILYLEDGIRRNESHKFINPFSANINDILCQSFFMKTDGFIGEHAKHIIMSLSNYLDDNGIQNDNNGNNDIKWDKSSSQYVIDIIGEPLIKNVLKQLYSFKFKDAEAIRLQIIQLYEELRQIEND